MNAAALPIFYSQLIARLLAACAVCLLVSVATAQSATRPVATTQAARVGEYESRSLDLKASDTRNGTAQAADTSAKPTTLSNAFDTSRVLAALVVVIGLIFGLRWVGQKYFGLPNARGTGVVRVLSRSVVSPKQNVLLIQVGRRVLVVGENGTSLTPLSEIKDTDEINALVGQLAEQRSAGPSVAGTFGSVFSRARHDFDDKDEQTEPAASSTAGQHEPSMNETRSELSGLLDKVRAVSRQLADR